MKMRMSYIATAWWIMPFILFKMNYIKLNLIQHHTDWYSKFQEKKEKDRHKKWHCTHTKNKTHIILALKPATLHSSVCKHGCGNVWGMAVVISHQTLITPGRHITTNQHEIMHSCTMGRGQRSQNGWHSIYPPHSSCGVNVVRPHNSNLQQQTHSLKKYFNVLRA